MAFSVPDIDDDDIEAVTQVLRSGWITSGSQCEALEEELAAYLGVPHVVSLSSATAALETAVAFLDLPPGARIGIPTWTFVSTALSAVSSGLQPVLLDIEPDTLNVDPDSLDRAIDGGLAAMTGVHFGGVPFGPEIHELCASTGIPLIEDAAHSLGARDHRGFVAGQGTAGACFSFYATKNLTSGEGGALATDDAELARFAKSFRLHGLSADAWERYRPGSQSRYDLVAAGIKGNLSDVLAALARSQLRRFNGLQARRLALVDRYRANLAGVDVRFVPHDQAEGSANHLVVVILPERAARDVVVADLSARGVSTSVHFQPLHTFGWFAANASVGPGGTPHADALAERALSLPLHTRLTLADVDLVCTALSDAIR
ncbi:MAG: DegT/DnrJ/EryC1/StrS aminotransferase family protein [Acidimicrobiia bacterium]|nr:DegT/DnrJ/EryC1/StrS aminotransferase family protein [Acidimicrobiia bacterium]